MKKLVIVSTNKQNLAILRDKSSIFILVISNTWNKFDQARPI